jgi:hypothetical protein
LRLRRWGLQRRPYQRRHNITAVLAASTAGRDPRSEWDTGPGMGGAFAPGGNCAGRTFVNPGFRGGRGFAFGFGGGPFWYDYGPDYAYDYDYGYGNSCYALERVFVAGRWRLRSIWICG